jgi:tetratricopeptide (TPR) repeat protein
LAAAPADDLGRARKMIDVELRYSAAIELLDRVLQDPDVSRKERVETYRLLGIAYAAKGKPDSAEAAFGALLELEPDFVLDPLLSPKIRSLFERAQGKTAKRSVLADVTAVPRDRRLTISARIEDPAARVQDILLFSRFGDREYENLAMQREGDRAEAILTLPQLDHLRAEYYLEARDAAGEVVARAGSSETPSAIDIARTITEVAPPPPPPPEVPAIEESTPWYAEWWVWTIAAGVIAAGVTTAVVIDRTRDDDPTGTLPPIRLD